MKKIKVGDLKIGDCFRLINKSMGDDLILIMISKEKCRLILDNNHKWDLGDYRIKDFIILNSDEIYLAKFSDYIMEVL